jgi:hypothetical protein
MSPEIEQLSLRIARGLANGEYEQSPTEITCPCPSKTHLANNSQWLRLYEKINKITGKPELGISCNGGCAVADVKKALFSLKLLPQEAKRNYEINIPPHDEPDFERLKLFDEIISPDKIWPKKDREGNIEFWLVRTSNKVFAKVFSVTDKNTQEKSFHWKESDLPLRNRRFDPYGSDILKLLPQAPVLVVSGFKTADAARDWLSPDWLVVAYDSDSSISHYNWDVLKNREVTLWPDNDTGGIKAARKLGAFLETAPKIVFTELLEGYPEKWDLADATPSTAKYSPEVLLRTAELLDITEEDRQAIKDPAELQAMFKLFDETLIPVHNAGAGGFDYYDVSDPMLSRPMPYRNYKPGNLQYLYPQVAKIENDQKIIDLWLMREGKKIASGIVYAPFTTEKLVIMPEEKHPYLNTFCGYPVEPIESLPQDSDWFTSHLENSLGKDIAEYVLDWIAHIIQKPAEKPRTMIIFEGPMGAGKSTIGNVLRSLLGTANFLAINSSVIDSQFTAEYATKQVVLFEERPADKGISKSFENTLKTLVTEDFIRYHDKGIRGYMIPSYHRIMLAVNDISDLKLSLDDRRVNIFKFHVIHLKRNATGAYYDPGYFGPIYSAIASQHKLGQLMFFLKTRKIKEDIFTPFHTVEREAQMGATDPVEAFVEDILQSGNLPKIIKDKMPNKDGVAGLDWPSEHVKVYTSLLHDAFFEFYKGISNSIPDHLRGIRLTKSLYKFFPQEGHKTISTTRAIGYGLLDPVKNTLVNYTERVFVFRPLAEARSIFEDVTKRTVKWEETVVEKVETGNVIDFPAKRRPEEVL